MPFFYLYTMGKQQYLFPQIQEREDTQEKIETLLLSNNEDSVRLGVQLAINNGWNEVSLLARILYLKIRDYQYDEDFDQFGRNKIAQVHIKFCSFRVVEQFGVFDLSAANDLTDTFLVEVAEYEHDLQEFEELRLHEKVQQYILNNYFSFKDLINNRPIIDK